MEANAKEPELLDFLRDAKTEHLQVVEALPRNRNGEIRSEILELVAMNQLDLIDHLIRTESERAMFPASSRNGATCVIVTLFDRPYFAMRAELRDARQISH